MKAGRGWASSARIWALLTLPFAVLSVGCSEGAIPLTSTVENGSSGTEVIAHELPTPNSGPPAGSGAIVNNASNPHFGPLLPGSSTMPARAQTNASISTTTTTTAPQTTTTTTAGLIVGQMSMSMLPKSGVRRVPQKYGTIQEAIDAAQNGDTVLVSDGTYSGQGNVELHCYGKKITITSVNGPATTTIDGGGTTVIFNIHEGETAATVIEGFTLTGGNNRISYFGRGGAIICGQYAAGGKATSVTIRNNILHSNYARGSGGAIFVWQWSNGSSVVEGNTFYDNSADKGGGTILTYADHPTTIRNNTVKNNAAAMYGGGIYALGGGGTSIEDNAIQGNVAGSSGFVPYGEQQGGGVYYYVGSAVETSGRIVNNIITGNEALNGQGGGIALQRYANGVQIINCTIAGNVSVGGGSVITGDLLDALHSNGQL